MKSTVQFLYKASILFLIPLFLTACPKKKQPLAPEEPVPEVTEPSNQEPAVEIGSEWLGTPVLPAIYFDTNKSDLTPETRAQLKKNAALLKLILAESSSVQVRVEGHCDDRNTLEYNLALGQRRANAVRDYYGLLGVAKTILDTVSFGEERPACTEQTEECWVKNRRGETTLKTSGEPIRIPLSKLSALNP